MKASALSKKFTDKQGNIQYNYRISIGEGKVWISMPDFKNHEDLLKVETTKTNDTIETIVELKEPLGDFYTFEKRKNKDGFEFTVLLPKKENNENSNIVSEPQVAYQASNNSINLNLALLKALLDPPKPDNENQNDEPEKPLTTLLVVPKDTSRKQTEKAPISNKKPRETEKSTKNNFVKDLLEYANKSKADNKTKERIFDLISQEVDKKGLTKEDVEKIVEEKLGGNGNAQKEGVKEKNERRHDPQKVINWLYLFTKENTHIKFCTHIWDDEKYDNYQIFIDGLNSDKRDYRIWELQYYNKNLYWEKIYPFIFQKEITKIQKDGKKNFGWGRFKIKIGWQYPNLIKQWCENHFDNRGQVGRKPMEMEIPNDLLPDTRIKGKTIKYFEDVVNVFKDEIEFRGNSLYLETKVLINSELKDFDIIGDIESLKGRNFYTNTESVIIAIRRIFKMIKARSEEQKVEICARTLHDSLFIEILHLNSFALKEIQHPKLQLDDDTGDLSIIRNTLTSLCDFAIESKFRDTNDKLKAYRIEYLYNEVEKNNWKPHIEELPIEKIEGFKFILKFIL